MDLQVESYRFSILPNDPDMLDIPRNFSYEENYHQKYYYPRLVLQRIQRRLAAASKVDSDSQALLHDSLSDSLPSLGDIASCTHHDVNGRPVDKWGQAELGPSNGLGLRRMSRSNDDISLLLIQASSDPSFIGDIDLRNASTADALPDGANNSASKNTKLSTQNGVYTSSFGSLEDTSNYIYFMSSRDLDDSDELSRGRSSRLRRSLSAKSVSSSDTSPKSPSVMVRRKSVRFADVLGLDLQSVRSISASDGPPVITRAALRDLQRGLEEANRTVGTRHMCLCFTPPGQTREPTGDGKATESQKPSTTSSFLARVLCNSVSLEGCFVGPRSMTLNGTVRVANLCFHKEVVIRYTLNDWVTFNDINASYVLDSSDGQTDRFTFSIALPLGVKLGGRLVFAVRYAAVDRHEVFWDNNGGENYRVECCAKFVPVCESDSAWIHFL